MKELQDWVIGVVAYGIAILLLSGFILVPIIHFAPHVLDNVPLFVFAGGYVLLVCSLQHFRPVDV